MKIARREYVTGLDRNDQHLVAHLYRGTYDKPGNPMCARGWNRSDGSDYSIFRNCEQKRICKVCLRRAEEKREPIKSVKRKTRWL
jgi:hypothetical protein